MQSIGNPAVTLLAVGGRQGGGGAMERNRVIVDILAVIDMNHGRSKVECLWILGKEPTLPLDYLCHLLFCHNL